MINTVENNGGTQGGKQNVLDLCAGMLQPRKESALAGATRQGKGEEVEDGDIIFECF
jgi:hypothetical protein